MLPFMEFVQNAFYEESNWNRDNSYGTITATSRNLLDFDTPNGLRFHVSSLSSPNFASSYTLGSIGLVDGSVSYLYSSLPFTNLVSSSRTVNLRRLVPGYRLLQDLRQPDQPEWWEIWHQGKRIDKRGALLYGRLFLPRSTLEALYMRRLTPQTQLKVSCVSDSRLPSGGTILAHLQHDTARHCTEYIYSTDSALLGIRGLYNFGPNPSRTTSIDPPYSHSSDPTIDAANRAAAAAAASTTSSPSTIPSPVSTTAVAAAGRLSAGAEIYYGILNKSGGLSAGLRFSTLHPTHQTTITPPPPLPEGGSFPYTMTLTLNPLMGNLSSTYSVLASPLLTLCSRFDFNVYSYESELNLGAELWRRKRRRHGDDDDAAGDDLEWARAKLGLTSSSSLEKEEEVVMVSESAQLHSTAAQNADADAADKDDKGDDDDANNDNNLSSCLKARLDLLRGSLALLWEGRTKDLLYSCGLNVELAAATGGGGGGGSGGGENMFRGVGVEVQYSS